MADFPSKTREIHGKEFKVHQLPMRRWLELETLVLRALGPAVAQLFSKAESAQSIADLAVAPEAIGQAIYQACTRASADDHAALLEALASCTMVDGIHLGSNSWQAFWPQNMRRLAPYIGFAIEVQFGDFLEGLGLKLGQ